MRAIKRFDRAADGVRSTHAEKQWADGVLFSEAAVFAAISAVLLEGCGMASACWRAISRSIAANPAGRVCCPVGDHPLTPPLVSPAISRAACLHDETNPAPGAGRQSTTGGGLYQSVIEIPGHQPDRRWRPSRSSHAGLESKEQRMKNSSQASRKAKSADVAMTGMRQRQA